MTASMFVLTVTCLSALALAAYTVRTSSQQHAADRELLLQMVVGAQTVATDAAVSTAKAIGDAVSVAVVGPPVPPESPQEVMARLSHEMAGTLPIDDVDDSDPTDSMIGVERLDAAIVDFTSSAPFGVPGLNFDSLAAAHAEVNGAGGGR